VRRGISKYSENVLDTSSIIFAIKTSIVKKS